MKNLLLIILLIFAGCAEKDFADQDSNKLPPLTGDTSITIIKSTPTRDQNFTLPTYINIEFSANIDPTSLSTDNIFMWNSNGDNIAIGAYVFENHLFIETNASLANNGQYEVRLGGSITDILGKPVSQDSTYQINVLSQYWKYLQVGSFHTLALAKNGAFFAWGNNEEGTLGDGSLEERKIPIVQVANFIVKDSKDSIAAGDAFSFIIDTEGQLWAWGRNRTTELGIEGFTQQKKPILIDTKIKTWTKVSAGKNHGLAISEGRIFGWGNNLNGQLGNGRLSSNAKALQEITEATDWESISAGGEFSVAIKTNGTLWSWGKNDFGQLGENSTATRRIPRQEDSQSTNWQSVCTGNNHTIALKTDGTLWAWGDNSLSQLGDNSNIRSSIPVAVSTAITNWKEISCGADHTLALTQDGTLWAWGKNSFSQLGSNDNIYYTTPHQEDTFSTNWESISAGGDSSAAIKDTGVRYAWGVNAFAQYGNGDITDSQIPVSIPEGL